MRSLVFVSAIALVATAAVAVAAMMRISSRNRRRQKASGGSSRATGRYESSTTLDISPFQSYADVYERRYLAYLIEETAERMGADWAAIDRLRAQYGKEVLAPPYEAQGWLYEKGFSLTDILHMQTEWIRRNAGNPEARPVAREIERIVKTRNEDKAREICRRAGLGPDAEKV